MELSHTLISSKFNTGRYYFGFNILRLLTLIKLLALCNFVAKVTPMPTCIDKSCLLRTSRYLLREEDSLSIGYGVELHERELLVNSQILAPMKAEELLHKGELSDESDLFEFIHKMPKGGNLHIHDTSMVNIHWVVSELTYLPNLYYCDTLKGKFVRYRYSDHVPEREDFCDDSWISVKERREEMGAEQFDKMLYNKMTLDRKDQGGEEAWDEFFGSIECVGDLMFSEAGFRPYFKQALTELYEDNVMYVELRTVMTSILTNSGGRLPREDTLRSFIEVTNEFKEENPEFIGAKFILLSVRTMPKASTEADIRLAMQLHQNYPNYLIGYDISGFETGGPPLSELLDILIIPAQNGVHLPFFFHAGETKKFGSIDENILFAILLNTTRIGHGFALTKHPLLMEMVKDRKIPIEVNPISNQVLNVVSDMRNHPGAVFFANGFPVVIGSDDPAPAKTSGLTYDYRSAFVAFTKEKDGLEVLKRLSRNGIEYSAMSEDEKRDALNKWEQRWTEFIYSFPVSAAVSSDV